MRGMRASPWQTAVRAAGAAAWTTVVLEIVGLVVRNTVTTYHVLIGFTCLLPFLLLPGVLGLALFALQSRWLALAAAAVVFACFSAPFGQVLLTWPKHHRSHDDLTLMTFNMRLGQADASAVVRDAQTHHVDILMLQELTDQALTRLREAGIDRQYEYSFTAPGGQGSGIGLFSRLSLTDQVKHPGFDNNVLSASVVLPSGQKVTVLSSHLTAPWPQPAREWRDECGRIAELLASFDTPVIDAGDFNATTGFRRFRELVNTGRMHDAASQIGAVSLRTYPNNRWWLPPFLGIDHVLLRDFSATSLKALTIRDSDHRALVVTVRPDGRTPG